MKSKVFKTTSFILLTLLTAFVMIFIYNMVKFNEIISNDYKTPWYDSSYLKEPYTNLKFAFVDKESQNTSWLLNSIRTEAWLVQTTQVGDKTFWTIIERKDMTNIKD